LPERQSYEDICVGRDAIYVHAYDPLSVREISGHQPQRFDAGTVMNACLRRDTKGVAAIEFAFIAPILFILLVGVVDLGRYFWIGSEVDHAIEAVLRDASVKKNLSVSDLTSQIKTRLASVSKQTFSVSANYTNSTADTPRLLTINITSSFKPLGLLSSLTFPVASTGQIPIIDTP
jgi:Flp pilus assembly protein TadG